LTLEDRICQGFVCWLLTKDWGSPVKAAATCRRMTKPSQKAACPVNQAVNQGARMGQDMYKSLEILEAGTGIEPVYTDLQSELITVFIEFFCKLMQFSTTKDQCLSVQL
jgi:hypothetical protein